MNTQPTHFDITVQSALDRIKLRNSKVNAFVSTRFPEAFLELEKNKNRTSRSPLYGVPYTLKDEWEVQGEKTTAGSYRHRDRISKISSPVYDVFKAAGAILIGKTNLSDMGIAPESTNYLVGATRNPFNFELTAGGSSGGAAAAVADRMSGFDWATDIGGSIRLPSAFCGTLGLRLSTSTWPIRGLFPELPAEVSFLCGQGPITRTVEQMRDVLSVAAKDLSIAPKRSWDLKKMMILVPDKPGQWPSCVSDIQSTLQKIAPGAVELNDGRIPSNIFMRNALVGLTAAFFMEFLACEPGISLTESFWGILSSVFLRGRLGDKRVHPTTAELMALIGITRIFLSKDKSKALAKIRMIQDAFGKLWDNGYVIVAPVCCYPAPKVGRTNRNFDIVSLTPAANLVDATALAIPFGFFENGMPRAIQFMGPPGSEGVLLDYAEKIMD